MKYLDIKQDIVFAAQSMELGETRRQICPSCNGGNKREKSLTITLFPNNLIKFNCFRGSCIDTVKGGFTLDGKHGIYNTEQFTAMPTPESVSKVVAKRKYFNGQTFPLPQLYKDWIWDKWGIINPPYWYYTPEYGSRIAMSVRSPMYADRGWVLRDISGTATHKALTYINKDETPLSWYKNKDKQGTILVEDIPSAVRASKYLNAVALLGTGVGLDRAVEIDISAPRPIIIALDQDATERSFVIKERWNLLWGDVRVLPLKHDLKDLQEKDLELLMWGCIND
jgi:hypothetical protein